MHKTTCSQTNSSCFCSGDGYSNGSTITYGNLGSSGTLTSGETLPTSFSYAGYATRLLTTQELKTACGVTTGNCTSGEMSTKCKYMLENTKYSSSSFGNYGWWTETTRAYYSDHVWGVTADNRMVNFTGASYAYSYGVRPVKTCNRSVKIKD